MRKRRRAKSERHSVMLLPPGLLNRSFSSSVVCMVPIRFAIGKCLRSIGEVWSLMAIVKRKNCDSIVSARFPSLIAVKVGDTTTELRLSGSAPRAPSATMSMHCRLTWNGSTEALPSSGSTVQRIVTKGVLSTPCAASSCSIAANMTSSAENMKPSSRGGWAKIQPTRFIPSISASRSTCSALGSSRSSKLSAVHSCGGSYTACTSTELSSSKVPYR
mmetsp:Transcript_12717/g.26721  ORF Transcript_12717/g.26721 Transcript_12717/m.26721 type:complete len:217 (+) Transcript_12717:285-935(+)